MGIETVDANGDAVPVVVVSNEVNIPSGDPIGFKFEDDLGNAYLTLDTSIGAKQVVLNQPFVGGSHSISGSNFNITGGLATGLTSLQLTTGAGNLKLLQSDAAGNASWQTISFSGSDTASNVGVSGVGVFKQKTGLNFEFRNINAGSNKVSITNDSGNNEIDIGLNESNIVIGNLSGAPSSTVVGISDTQTLTNKTISAASNTISGLTSSSVGLSNVVNTKVNLAGTTTPSVSNDNTQGYSTGSLWVDTVNGKTYQCLTAGTGTASWKETTNPTNGTVTNNGTSTNLAIAKFDGVTGLTIQNSGVTIDASNNLNTSGEYQISGTKLGINNLNLVTLTSPATNDLLTYNGTNWVNLPLLTIGLNEYYIVKDSKSSGSQGGTFTSGAWRTRTLNSLTSYSGSSCSLSSDRITLTAGTYMIKASCPAFRIDGHMARLMNITDNSVTATGTSEYTRDSSTSCTTRSLIDIIVTITSSKVYEIQHYSISSESNNGLGAAVGISGVNETYTIVHITKLKN